MEIKMYTFIKENRNGYLVNKEDIKEIEEFWNIKFPMILKDFYINYNGAKINLCKFSMDGFEYEISEMLPLKYGQCNFEDVIKNDREDGIIPNNMLPIANNRGGDYYYWDEVSKKIFLYCCDDIENPVYICDNIEELFKLMTNSCF